MVVEQQRCKEAIEADNAANQALLAENHAKARLLHPRSPALVMASRMRLKRMQLAGMAPVPTFCMNAQLRLSWHPGGGLAHEVRTTASCDTVMCPSVSCTCETP